METLTSSARRIGSGRAAVMIDRCQECGARLGPVEYVKEVESYVRLDDGTLTTRVIERVVCIDCMSKEADDATDDA